MLLLEKNALKIITDSGGIQKEAFLLKTPCVTLRDETEWKETLNNGWNITVGAEKERITESVLEPSKRKNWTIKNPFGEGKSSENIVKFLVKISEESA